MFTPTSSWQTLAEAPAPARLDSRLSPPFAPVGRSFAADLLHARGEVGDREPADLPPPRPLLSVRQVAELLGVSRASVYKLVERGELAHVRISNAIRVRPVDLERWLEGRVCGG